MYIKTNETIDINAPRYFRGGFSNIEKLLKYNNFNTTQSDVFLNKIDVWPTKCQLFVKNDDVYIFSGFKQSKKHKKEPIIKLCKCKKHKIYK